MFLTPWQIQKEEKILFSRNPLKSGQCFLQWSIHRIQGQFGFVAIPSNRVNVSYMAFKSSFLKSTISVAIPSNRVNVSYKTGQGSSTTNE